MFRQAPDEANMAKPGSGRAVMDDIYAVFILTAVSIIKPQRFQALWVLYYVFVFLRCAIFGNLFGRLRGVKVAFQC